MSLRLVVDNTKELSEKLSEKITDWTEFHVIVVPQKNCLSYHLQTDVYPGDFFARVAQNESSPYYVDVHGLKYFVNSEHMRELPERFVRTIKNIHIGYEKMVCYGTQLLTAQKREGLNVLHAFQYSFPDPLYCLDGKLLSADEALNK